MAPDKPFIQVNFTLALYKSNGLYKRKYLNNDLSSIQSCWQTHREEIGRHVVFQVNKESLEPAQTEFDKLEALCGKELNVGPYNTRALDELKQMQSLKKVKRVSFVSQFYKNTTCIHVFAENAHSNWERVGEPVIAIVPTTAEREIAGNRYIEDLLHTLCMPIITSEANIKTTAYQLLKYNRHVLTLNFGNSDLYNLVNCDKTINCKCTVKWYSIENEIDNSTLTIDAPNINLTRRKDRFSLIKKDTTNSHTLIVASPCVREALVHLQNAWNAEKVKSVMLWAPPGSGKEVLVDAFEAAWGATKIQLPVIGFSAKDLNEYFLEILRTEGIIEKSGNKYRVTNENRKILIFADEIDKAEREIRSFFLRVLDPGELLKLEKIPPSWCFMFTGSIGLAHIQDLPPKDFWTRMNHVVDMKHPLSIENPLEQETVIESYLQLFWEKTWEWEKYIKGKNSWKEPLIAANKMASKMLAGPLGEKISIRLLNLSVSNIAPKILDIFIENTDLEKEVLKKTIEKELLEALHKVLHIYIKQTTV